jgi:hypothetical protein
MELDAVRDAVTSLEKANANLEPELLSIDDARTLLATYARAVKLASYGQTALAPKLDDAAEVARTTGVSMRKEGHGRHGQVSERRARGLRCLQER